MGRYYYSNKKQIASKIFDPVLGWRLRPGTYWIKPRHTFKKHSFYINKFGLRSRDFTNNPDKEMKRIMILGDSFTFAMEARYEDIFSTKLEKILNESSPSNYEVINAGVPGYGNAQELLFMKMLTDNNLTGDIYVLMIFINDILDNLALSYSGKNDNLVKTHLQPRFILDEEGRVKLKHYPKMEYSANLVPLEKRSKMLITPEVLRRKIEIYLQTKPTLVRTLNGLGFDIELQRIPGLLNGWYRKEVLNSGIPLMKALITEIRNEALKNDAKLLIGIIPSPIQIYPDIYGSILKRSFPDSKIVNDYFNDMIRPQKIIANICTESDIPFIDFYPILLQNNNKELFIPADGHFSISGHTVVAHNLAKFIMENTAVNYSNL